jgi:hypothetical protein
MTTPDSGHACGTGPRSGLGRYTLNSGLSITEVTDAPGIWIAAMQRHFSGDDLSPALHAGVFFMKMHSIGVIMRAQGLSMDAPWSFGPLWRLLPMPRPSGGRPYQGGLSAFYVSFRTTRLDRLASRVGIRAGP